MGTLLNLVPFYYRWIALGLLLAAIYATGYYRGGIGPREQRDAAVARFEAFSAQVKSLGDQAKATAEAKDRANELAKEQANAKLGQEITKISASWAADRAERDRLRKQLSDSNSRPVPQVAIGPGLSCNPTSNATISAAVSGYVEAARRAFDDCRAAAYDFRESVAEQLKTAELNTANLSCGVDWAASVR